MTDKPPMPQHGGSYIRQPDGSLVLESRTEDAAAPIGLAEAEPVGDGNAPARPRKPRQRRPAAVAPAEPAADPQPASDATTPEETA